MKVAVLGAGGFIGSQAVRMFLAAGWQVAALVRAGSDPWRLSEIEGRCTRVETDLMTTEAVLQAVTPDVEVFVNAAWDTTPGAYLMSESNFDYAEASVMLVRALSKRGCAKFIGLGTCQEYAPLDLPLTEDSPLAPVVPYSKAKASVGLFLEGLSRVSQLEAAWLRVFNVYGPCESVDRLVPYVIRRLLKGEPAEVSAGEQVRDYLHVRDVASAIVRVAESGTTGFVNVGSGRPVRVRKVIGELAALLGGQELVRYGAIRTHPGEFPYVVSDNRKLQSTGWREEFTLSEGLYDTVSWWKDHFGSGTC